MQTFSLSFDRINIQDISIVGGKNASLGEMYQQLVPKGILVPDGFAVTADAYWHFIHENNIKNALSSILQQLDTTNFSNLKEVGANARRLILNASVPNDLKSGICMAYQALKNRTNENIQVAVRSSATAEDLPEASFAGQQESYLNIRSEEELLSASLRCYASLFTDRAIKYRCDQGYNHMDVALSIGVQQMVRSDKACAGVAFTLEPESGFRNVIVINGAWGLGENVVKGNVDPDEFILFKPGLIAKKKCLLQKKLGAKQKTMVYADPDSRADLTTLNTDTPMSRQNTFILEEDELEKLGNWCLIIEDHYGIPMDIEWAKDGLTNELFIVQARPETVHAPSDKNFVTLYKIQNKGKVLASGNGLGNKITAGKARILSSPEDAHKLQAGEVLVTDTTDPDWDPILKKAAAVITNKGGRTSHAAIVARELGAVAIVGTGDATQKIKDGQEVTVSCAEGKQGFVYEGILDWEESPVDLSALKLPQTKTMLILGNPEKAFHLAALPNHGIGLMRMEFIINNAIQIHPMALVEFDKLQDARQKAEIETLTFQYPDKPRYFIDKLAQAIATIAAAFYPKEVIVRMSDFKSNEYANLLGGEQFEPREENPMLGFRGASRYYSDRYKEGFRLECEAIKIVRNEMGLQNVKLMIPFCRSIDEGKKVLALMKEFGLAQGQNGLQIYTMIEIPSNAVLADQFARLFDGFSIGSNDLTQLTLGLDRDNALISSLFDENDEAVKALISMAIKSAKDNHIEIGLCGQAPSDFPEFAKFLVSKGINSISFNPDALINGIKNILEAESESK